ncbi:hypothetical protein Taro_029290 [Colocasia esculenta]|uniref:Uncharacterized protein n=1 Tax=Colocasia esculenta TaxID=4460 RepID=A0A843VSV2_COLES|nr:hypothetical protein [Colocasia esculenta]
MCIEERGLFGCFYLLKMKDYDAILGQDWLEEHYALVDCRGKKITFRIPGEDEFSHPLPRNLAGTFVISAMKAIRIMNKGETGVPWLEEDIVRSDSDGICHWESPMPPGFDHGWKRPHPTPMSIPPQAGDMLSYGLV